MKPVKMIGTVGGGLALVGTYAAAKLAIKGATGAVRLAGRAAGALPGMAERVGASGPGESLDDGLPAGNEAPTPVAARALEELPGLAAEPEATVVAIELDAEPQETPANELSVSELAEAQALVDAEADALTVTGPDGRRRRDQTAGKSAQRIAAEQRAARENWVPSEEDVETLPLL